MPWLKVGDDFAMHPRILRILEVDGIDDRTINEAIGVLVRCATMAAGYLTDYRIAQGVAITVAGMSRYKDVMRVLEKAELIERKPAEEGGWEIIQDPDFIHMFTAEEIEWERQRKSDNGNPELTIPVRLRDGDCCRYCGKVVKFGQKRGGRRGTYDHREPGQPATYETMVVACGACNSARRNNPDADREYPLLPVPNPPYYSQETIEWINGHPWTQGRGLKLPSKASKFTPVGAVAPGHERAVIQREGLLAEAEEAKEAAVWNDVLRHVPTNCCDDHGDDHHHCRDCSSGQPCHCHGDCHSDEPSPHAHRHTPAPEDCCGGCTECCEQSCASRTCRCKEDPESPGGGTAGRADDRRDDRRDGRDGRAEEPTPPDPNVTSMAGKEEPAWLHSDPPDWAVSSPLTPPPPASSPSPSPAPPRSERSAQAYQQKVGVGEKAAPEPPPAPPSEGASPIPDEPPPVAHHPKGVGRFSRLPATTDLLTGRLKTLTGRLRLLSDRQRKSKHLPEKVEDSGYGTGRDGYG